MKNGYNSLKIMKDHLSYKVFFVDNKYTISDILINGLKKQKNKIITLIYKILKQICLIINLKI